jgi:hypothetical protein
MPVPAGGPQDAGSPARGTRPARNRPNPDRRDRPGAARTPSAAAARPAGPRARAIHRASPRPSTAGCPEGRRKDGGERRRVPERRSGAGLPCRRAQASLRPAPPPPPP